MNKKQLMIIWAMGSLIALFFMFWDVKSVYFKKEINCDTQKVLNAWRKQDNNQNITYKYGVFFKKSLMSYLTKDIGFYQQVIFYRLMSRIFPVLIIGSLLIYTLKDKKK